MCGGRRVSGLLRKADEARHSSIFRKHHFDAPLDRSSWPSQAAKHREKTTRSADRRIVAAVSLHLEWREAIPRGGSRQFVEPKDRVQVGGSFVLVRSALWLAP